VEADDHVYKIPARNREHRKTFQSQFEGEEQEEVVVRSTAS